MPDAVLPRRFIFLRHGRSAWNARGLVAGQEDVPLDDQGRAEAEAAADVMADVPLSGAWCSPLSRCRDTLAPLLRRRPDLPVTVVPDLMERHWGVYQNGPVKARPPRAETPRGGEPAAAFHARALAAIASAGTEHVGAPPPLIVAHAGIFRCLMDHLGLPGADATVANAMPLLIEPAAPAPRRVRPLHPPVSAPVER
ncbi:phosphoglycerate mutase [Caenispirillum salinarum AK4]|uniref:Phosphoglycerate mutase n=1 Tax=Caenispirillum salinarum AK4 TaxID=1238182 RepID=K9GZ46_9PROT|nr:histidine phosphatase family protein [Caenispirillum salinarum]EKV30054.1 phosphoglycerate mutase [Caenispirillum salinarum AK4]